MAEDRTGVVARLDALEAAHKGATPGKWTRDDGYLADFVHAADGAWIGQCNTAADAAAIVAEHNAFGDLLAIVRGVLVEHQPIDDGGINSGHCAVDGFPWPCLTYRTVAAALGEA